ncbi:MAG TPA: hypothetical protein VI172_16005 [Candidatus Dormibacteraeota bacterium]|jgi:hypothetical protein
MMRFAALVLLLSAPLADAARKHDTTVERADRALRRAPHAKRHAFLECLDTESDDDTTPLDRCVGELE